MNASAEYVIGLMSGTSLDGVDGVLCNCANGRAQVLAHHWQGFDTELASELLALNHPGDNELHRAALAANRLAGVYAEVVHALLAAGGLPAAAVRAIGAHGQTVRHRPGEFDGLGYSLQINAPAVLAERCGVAVVADFRSRDVAAGGQGAPLVPAFHAACFGRKDQPVAVLNLGGMANLSILPTSGEAWGFDCGPGNVLMDAWTRQHRGQAYDAGGTWAASGHVLPDLLAACLAEPYFDLPPPKSTGRDRFDAAWLQARLNGLAASRVPDPADVQATLCELSAATCALALRQHAPQVAELIVCGGGAFNTDLLTRLRRLLPQVAVRTSDADGLPPTQVEAAAFAWLAWVHLQERPGNLPRATGAAGPRILGCLYPA